MPTDELFDLRAAWKGAIRGVAWPCTPPLGLPWTEHRLGLVDLISRVTEELAQVTGDPFVPNRLYADPVLGVTIQMVAPFHWAPAQIASTRYKVGTLAGIWTVFLDLDRILDKGSILIVGQKGSAKIISTGSFAV